MPKAPYDELLTLAGRNLTIEISKQLLEMSEENNKIQCNEVVDKIRSIREREGKWRKQQSNWFFPYGQRENNKKIEA